MSPGKFASLRGVTRQAVMRRIAAGSLPTSAVKVRGRWQIDAVRATAEWDAHTRPRVDGRHGNSHHKVHPCHAACFDLITLLVRIEKRLAAVVEELTNSVPDYPTAAWPNLGKEWARIPDAVERLQHALKTALPLYTVNEG